MRCACIDIGSNTTRLLVAEPGPDGRLREILAQRAFTRLGRGRAPEDDIPPKKILLAAEVVATQAELARQAGADRLCAVATAAIRQAANRDAFCAAVAERSGLEVRVLSGEEEARFAFAGATGSLVGAPDGLVAVVDVGGGSSELVAGTMAGGVTWSASFRVGSGFLADHYLRSDPPAPAELEAVRRHVQGVFEGLDAPRPDAAYAVGGSATSLRRLIGAVLDSDSLTRGLRVVTGLPHEEVARRFDLHPERARILPAGLLLLDEAAATLGAPLRICGGGLREGVVLDELAKLRGTDGQGA